MRLAHAEELMFQSLRRSEELIMGSCPVKATEASALIKRSTAPQIERGLPIFLKNNHVLCFRLAGLAVLTDIKADLLAIRQGASEADSRDMDEHIRSTIVRRNKSEALVLREKFDRTSCHHILIVWLRAYGIRGKRG